MFSLHLSIPEIDIRRWINKCVHISSTSLSLMLLRLFKEYKALSSLTLCMSKQWTRRPAPRGISCNPRSVWFWTSTRVDRSAACRSPLWWNASVSFVRVFFLGQELATRILLCSKSEKKYIGIRPSFRSVLRCIIVPEKQCIIYSPVKSCIMGMVISLSSQPTLWCSP